MKSILIFIIVVSLAIFSFAGVPLRYPLFTQCDPSWGNDTMADATSTHAPITICQQGCAMSCVSMALAGHNFTLDGVKADPKTLNQWLHKNHGYTCINNDCANLVLDSPNKVAPGKIKFISEAEKPSITTLKSYIDSVVHVSIFHVRNKSHFVLGIGYPSTSFEHQQIDATLDQPLNDDDFIFYVNDPFFNVQFYKYSDISDMLLYEMAI